MCIIDKNLDKKTKAVGYKIVAVDPEGNFFSPFTGKQYKIGVVPLPPEICDRISHYFSDNLKSGLLTEMTFYNRNFIGSTAIFINHIEAWEFLNQMLEFKVEPPFELKIVQMELSEVWGKGLYSSNPILVGKVIEKITLLPECYHTEVKVTPENITSLKENEVFVFGSNLAGRHGAGAAKTAQKLFGAKSGVGSGMTGSCYALPTKDEDLNVRELEEIHHSIHQLYYTIRSTPEKHFLITKIGCGYAGYTPEQIAPFFSYIFAYCENVSLPQEFINILKK